MMFSSFISFIQVLTISFYVHPIHVSVTEIEFDQKDKALEIMMRIFIDDLETSLREELNQPELDIAALKKGVTLDQLVNAYLKDHFKITLDNKLQKTNFLGHERESEAIIFYIEVDDVNSWQTIKIQNDILVATFDDQSNLVHVTVGDKVKSLRLTKSTPADKLTFEN
jgi:hypothetical protein